MSWRSPPPRSSTAGPEQYMCCCAPEGAGAAEDDRRAADAAPHLGNFRIRIGSNKRMWKEANMNASLRIPFLVCAGAVLSACGLMADSDWHKATLANSIAAYETFVQEHPDNKHADNARGRILALRDEHAWSAARAGNNIASYEGYLKAESGGVRVGDAKYQITAL